MTKAISFAWTTAALLCDAKTVTRRLWKEPYARGFEAGEQVVALNKDRRAGGRPVAVIELTRAPYSEPLALMPDTDYACEGFEWLHQHPALRPAVLFGRPTTDRSFSRAGFEDWRQSGGEVWVVRFRLVEVL